jgi:hypothetical protein
MAITVSPTRAKCETLIIYHVRAFCIEEIVSHTHPVMETSLEYTVEMAFNRFR